MVIARSFVFVSQFPKKILYFGIMIFWAGGENRIEKNEKCAAFPES